MTPRRLRRRHEPNVGIGLQDLDDLGQLIGLDVVLGRIELAFGEEALLGHREVSQALHLNRLIF